MHLKRWSSRAFYAVDKRITLQPLTITAASTRNIYGGLFEISIDRAADVVEAAFGKTLTG
jgi:hypothetical protein